MPLKQLPEWTQINKAPLPALSPSIDQEKKTGAVKEKKEETPQPNSNTRKKINPNKGPKENSNHSFADPETANNGMGILGKILVTGAVLIFLSAIGVVVFLIYKNLDKFIPQKLKFQFLPHHRKLSKSKVIKHPNQILLHPLDNF